MKWWSDSRATCGDIRNKVVFEKIAGEMVQTGYPRDICNVGKR